VNAFATVAAATVSALLAAFGVEQLAPGKGPVAALIVMAAFLIVGAMRRAKPAATPTADRSVLPQ
jgi:hypothetical protein